MTEKRPTKGTLYIRGLNPSIKNRFKSWCALRGMSMREKLEQMMDDVSKEGVSLEIPVKK